MEIPEQFIIHNHVVKVIIKDHDNPDSNRYGYYDSIKEEIVLFTKLWSDGELIQITNTQLMAGFFHELIHCFQWHIKGDTDECEAQAYSGLILEFLESKE